MRKLTDEQMKMACELPAVFISDCVVLIEKYGLRLTFVEQTAGDGLFARVSVLIPHDRAIELHAAITDLFKNVEAPDTDTRSNHGQTH